MNYESELSDVLEEALSQRFGLERNAYLHLYVLLRYEIWKFNKKQDRLINPVKQFLDYLRDDLHLPITEKGLVYKGEWFSIFYAKENSLTSIIENWKFQYEKELINDKNGVKHLFPKMFEKLKTMTFKKAKAKARYFKPSPYYEFIVCYYALQIINHEFNITLNPPTKIPHLDYSITDVFFLRTMEEQCEAYYHAVSYQRNDTKTISESDLEEYLARRLYLIEEGLTLIERQYLIEDGRIDILARDKEQNLVIIELKIQEDKTIVWQCLYYPEIVKKEFKSNHVRMITLAPNYSFSIQLALKQIPYVEVYQYKPEIKLGKIQSISVENITQQKNDVVV